MHSVVVPRQEHDAGVCAGCPESTYKELPPQAFYHLLQDLLPTAWECAASDGQREIANKITEHYCGQLDWFGHHGPRLQTLCEGFAEFSDRKDSVNPQEPDYNAAWTMVDRASQVQPSCKLLSLCSIALYIQQQLQCHITVSVSSVSWACPHGLSGLPWTLKVQQQPCVAS